MHRLRCVFGCSSNGPRLQKHLSGTLKLSFINSSPALNRSLCTKQPDEDVAGKVQSGKGNPKDNERTAQAKVKLDNLLKSIVQNSKMEAKERKSSDSTIDMKLAVPQKIKPQIEKDSKTPEEKEVESDLGKELTGAVKQVAECIEGDPKVVESELVQKLRTQVGKKVNLSDVFSGMKIDRGSKAGAPASGDMELSRAHRVRRLLDERTKESNRVRSRTGPSPTTRERRVPVSQPTYVPIDLFGAPPLGIFSVQKDSAKVTQKDDIPKKLDTWDLLSARDLKLSVTHPPSNGFEEMILWTEQGKLWKFPIDNEQGLDEESKVPFHEHVFLEPQLEAWCPKKGPIRHFMELVCVGLSKNPFLTVKEKHEQIEWYHEYFKEKTSVIKEVGAGEIK